MKNVKQGGIAPYFVGGGEEACRSLVRGGCGDIRLEMPATKCRTPQVRSNSVGYGNEPDLSATLRKFRESGTLNLAINPTLLVVQPCEII